MKRYDVINHLIEKYKLERYLEIGLNDATQNFDKINCEYKVSVDPELKANATFVMTSDEFFDNAAYAMGMNDQQFDCVFLDGLHSAEQLEKDFFGCLKYVRPNGWVIMHDTSPESEELTHFPRDKKGSWNGSAYKFAASLFAPMKFTVDVDHGCTCVQVIGTLIKDTDYPEWDDFNTNRKEYLNLISYDEFISIGSHV